MSAAPRRPSRAAPAAPTRLTCVDHPGVAGTLAHVPLRRLLALIAILALLSAGVCSIIGILRWRTQRAADSVAAGLSPMPAASPTAAVPITPASRLAAPSTNPPATARRLDVAWHDGDGRPYRTRITLDGTGARVETASDGRPLVSYRASVRRRADGTLIIDATDAAVSGPAAAEWVADSFTIRADGSVSVQDGKHAPCDGYLAQESEQRVP